MDSKKWIHKITMATLSLGLISPLISLNAEAEQVSPNEDRLLKTLVNEGVISRSATPKRQEERLQQYMQQKGKQYDQKYIKNKGKFDKTYKKGNNGKRLGQLNKNEKDMYKKGNNGKRVGSIEKEQYNGEVRKDKVLVIGIEFPDYPNSSITKEETDMYYEDYPISHFQDMVFGENGYKGPNGENLLSMKQFYKKQSGGSYDVDGEVQGWYKAKHEASYYGGNVPDENGSDGKPKELVKEALEQVAQDSNVDLSDYDQWDRDDIDGDGVYNEKDGIVDHIMIVHSGSGEEAGGGKLGTDAIWSHRWSLDFNKEGEPYTIPNTKSGVDNFDGKLAAIDYTIQPEDGAAGVFTHEYGHDLGLPDEYDTKYTGKGEPVSFWSIMSSGSWAGKIPGTEPTGFDPYMKEMLQEKHGGNWQKGEALQDTDVNNGQASIMLDEAVSKGTNNDVVRVNLPDKATLLQKPAQGKKAYWGDAEDNTTKSMETSLDLSKYKQSELNFKTWYDIEPSYDYGYVQVSTDEGKNWENLKGNITNNNDADNSGQNQGNGIDGKSNQYTDAKFDLSKYAGKKVKLRFTYVTDMQETYPGWFIDQISVKGDGKEIFSDDAEGESKFDLQGFKQSDGNRYDENYYLLQWRSHNDVDKGLEHIKRGGGLMSYNKGLTVWYVDKSFSNNLVAEHPGQGFIGIVDADQNILNWEKKGTPDDPATTQFQIRDAAFSLDHQPQLKLTNEEGFKLHDNKTKKNPLFDDSQDYSNKGQEHAGKLLPNNGLKFEVAAKSKDDTVGKVNISK